MPRKNEFQMTIIAARKALQKQVDNNPKSGAIVDRGLFGESKITNAEAIVVLDRLEKYFLDARKRSWELCDNCGERRKEYRCNTNTPS